MKKILLLLAFASLSLYSYSQEESKQYYLYNIVTFKGSLKNEGFKVDVDNGKEIDKLRDADGKKMNFKTPAAALMYFIDNGWELYVNGSTSQGASYAGTGGSETTTYWIMRKPCSKEEFKQAVVDGIKY